MKQINPAVLYTAGFNILCSKNQDFFNDMISDRGDEYLIKNGIVNYVISMIVEESCVKISFDANHYNSKSLFRSIKELA